MADHAKFRGGVGGLFHTDELPGHDITAEEVHAVRTLTNTTEKDAVVMVADDAEKCRKALAAVVDRAREALTGVPSETRAADADGTTHFTRPRPGAARMYPETDIVSTTVTPERLERLRAALPEMPDDKLERFKADYGINEKLARQIINSEHTELFEVLAGESVADSTLLAVTLTETLKSLKRDGVEVGNLEDADIRGVFECVGAGKTTKESLPQVLTWIASNPGGSPAEALRELGLEMLSLEELRSLVEEKVSGNREMVERMGERAFGPLMGMVMGEVRGRARAEDVQSLLREALASPAED
jgi:glutamyl-tRNA(Gln) amidotransferase subunit E